MTELGTYKLIDWVLLSQIVCCPSYFILNCFPSSMIQWMFPRIQIQFVWWRHKNEYESKLWREKPLEIQLLKKMLVILIWICQIRILWIIIVWRMWMNVEDLKSNFEFVGLRKLNFRLIYGQEKVSFGVSYHYNQGSQTRSPRAACGPPGVFLRLTLSNIFLIIALCGTWALYTSYYCPRRHFAYMNGPRAPYT